MDLEILVAGKPIVKATIDLPLLARLLQSASKAPVEVYRSTAVTPEQMTNLLNSIDPRSAMLLREIAASPDGSISWTRMRTIFGIADDDNWAAYSGSFGKGITRALRFATGSKAGKLIWWNNEQWGQAPWIDEGKCRVYIDGPALESLRDVA